MAVNESKIREETFKIINYLDMPKKIRHKFAEDYSFSNDCFISYTVLYSKKSWIKEGYKREDFVVTDYEKWFLKQGIEVGEFFLIDVCW